MLNLSIDKRNRKMLTKATLLVHLTTVRMAVTNKILTDVDNDLHKREPLYTAGGNVNYFSH